MAYRLNLGSLRGMDALTLEITIQDALRRPLGSIEPSSLGDLFALAEVEDIPSGVRVALEVFVPRMANEIVDLPPQGFITFVQELDALGSALVPQTLRDAIATNAASDARANERTVVGALIEGWGGTEPTPFEISGGAARVRRAPEARRNDSRFQGQRTGERGEPATKTKRASKKPTTRTLELSGSTDIDKDRWVEHACLERLAGVSDKGLLEAVLLAGVRHGARTRYPELGGHEVKTALSRLKDRGAVRYSAGRWSHAGRRW